jgi:hypothetical protein
MRLLVLFACLLTSASLWADEKRKLPELKKYTDDGLKFSVLMPGKPKDAIGGAGSHSISVTVVTEKSDGPPESTAQRKQAVFSVSRESARDLLKADADAIKKALTAYRDQVAKDAQGKVRNEKTAKLGEVEGLEFWAEGKKHFVRCRVFIVRRKLGRREVAERWTLSVWGAKAIARSPTADKFIDSLQLNK